MLLNTIKMPIEDELRKIEGEVNKYKSKYKSESDKRKAFIQKEVEKVQQEKKVVKRLMNKINETRDSAERHAPFFDRIKIKRGLKNLEKEIKSKYPKGYREYINDRECISYIEKEEETPTYYTQYPDTKGNYP